MEDNEPHAVVRLLLKRMESHPEEFGQGTGNRWGNIIEEITEYGNEADTAAVNAKLRDIRLQEAHEEMMDELCNGPERRRKEEEEREHQRQQLIRRQTQQQYTAQQQAYQNQYANQLGRYQNSVLAGTPSPTLGLGVGSVGTDMNPVSGKSASNVWLDDYRTPISNTLTTTIDQIKEMLGNKK
jgi:hypothetical protein